MTCHAANPEAHLACVVAGHVDHGKSTLVGCLARQLHEAGIGAGAMDVAVADPAFFTDRLQQEREGRMTIDSAAVRFDLPAGHLTLVDVPGHAEFLQNMMTGATRTTSGVLVVAADEGPQEQTEAHIRLMAFCGVRRIILAVTKMDLVDWARPRHDRIRTRIEALLAELGMQLAATVPTAAATGANILRRDLAPPWCGETLLDALHREMARPSDESRDAVPRFVVQSVLRLPGMVPLCAGRVLGAPLAAGQILWPVGANRSVEVVRIARHPHDPGPARPGESVAVELDAGSLPPRGAVLEAVPGSTPMAREFAARIAWIGGEIPHSRLVAQWLYRTTTIAPRQTTERLRWQVTNGLLRIQDSLLSMRAQEPLMAFADCQELGRFVLSADGKFAGAGIVTELLPEED